MGLTVGPPPPFPLGAMPPPPMSGYRPPDERLAPAVPCPLDLPIQAQEKATANAAAFPGDSPEAYFMATTGSGVGDEAAMRARRAAWLLREQGERREAARQKRQAARARRRKLERQRRAHGEHHHVPARQHTHEGGEGDNGVALTAHPRVRVLCDRTHRMCGCVR